MKLRSIEWIVLVLAAAGIARGQACRLRPLMPGHALSSATAATALKGAIDKVTVTALDDDNLLICGETSGAKLVDDVIDTMDRTASKKIVTDPPGESHTIRLFFNRRATDIAKAVTVTTGVAASAVGEDLIVFNTENRADDAKIKDTKRWIATLDVPLPEVALNAWSFQISSGDKDLIAGESAEMRRRTEKFNHELQEGLDAAWKCADDARMDPAFSDLVFVSYILWRYDANKTGWLNPATDEWCGGAGQYCLGFIEAFPRNRPMQPSLSNLIGVLAAAKLSSKDSTKVASAITAALEGRVCTAAELLPSAPASSADRTGRKLEFSTFEKQLAESLDGKRLALLRTAIADFFYQYKRSVFYPHDISPYDFAASLQALNRQLDPILVAFNQDVARALSLIETDVADFMKNEKVHGRNVDFQSSGVVSLRTISGTASEADVKTQNVFTETAPPLVQDFLKNLSTQTAPSTVLTENLATRGAMALTAFLNSGASTRVSIGREMDFKVTPHSLPGASATELEITLSSKDSGSPSLIKPDDSSSAADTTSRIAGDMVQTNVRVDSLKVFEISSFSGSLSRGKKPIPLLPPFVELPVIGSFIKYKPRPSTVYHRSFAIVSATIVPTATDMLLSLRFHRDLDANGKALTASPVQAAEFHRLMLDCISQEATAKGVALKAGCLPPALPTPAK
jgi:hypothetical protein